MRVLRWGIVCTFPVLFLLIYSVCVTVMILHLTAEQRTSDSEHLLRVREVKPAPDASTACRNMELLDEISFKEQIKWRQKLIATQCSMCKGNGTSRYGMNASLCQDMSTKKAVQFKNILVDDQSKVLYCMVPKIGSTNWKRALLKLRIGKWNFNTTREFNIHSRRDMRHAGFTFLDLYPFEERQFRINNYLKFAFVRNPFDRLVSAYRDKFTRNSTWSVFFQRKYGRAIIEKFRPNATEDIKLQGMDVTFSEFIKYIISSYHDNHILNVHWTPYHQLCHPCDIKYHFVGKFESFESDANWVLSKISGKKCPFHFPSENVNQHLPLPRVMKYYQILGAELLADFYGMYQPDFDMFGYDIQRVARTGQIVI